MPNVDELLGIGAAPKTEAEELAARQIPGSAVTGGLSGILAGSVLGGPIGALVGLGMGINSQRLKRNAIDQTAADIAASDKFAWRTMEQLTNSVDYAKQYGTEQDVAQVGDIAESVRRYQELAQHHNPQIRQMALAGLATADARMDTWRQDIENRSREIADRDFDFKKELAAEYRQQVVIEMDALEDLAIASNTLLANMNELGADNEIVQSLARNYAEFTFKEAEAAGANLGFNLGIVSGGFNTGDFKLTGDQISRMVAATMKAQKDVRLQRVQQIQQQAVGDGFEINMTDKGVDVRDTNTAIQDFRTEVPKVVPPKESSFSNIINPGVDEETGEQIGNPYTNALKSIFGIATSAGKGVVDFVKRPTN